MRTAKVITPSEVNDKFFNDKDGLFHKVCEEFHTQFLKDLSLPNSFNEHYHIIIKGEYPKAILDRVAQHYRNNGWYGVVCKTSSENGERSGLTSLRLNTTKGNKESDKKAFLTIVDEIYYIIFAKDLEEAQNIADKHTKFEFNIIIEYPILK